MTQIRLRSGLAARGPLAACTPAAAAAYSPHAPPSRPPAAPTPTQLLVDHRQQLQAAVMELVEKVLTLKGHTDARAHEHFKYARDTLDDSLLELVSCLQPRHSKFGYQLLAKSADPAKAARGWRCGPGPHLAVAAAAVPQYGAPAGAPTQPGRLRVALQSTCMHNSSLRRRPSALAL